jgi:hypothetical protein
VVRRTARSRVRRKKGAIVALYTAPPEGSVVVCLDEMGPEAAKSFPGRAVVRPAPADGAGRATQEIDYGRRGTGDVFGAFRPATGEVFTVPYPGRTIANRVAFLEEVNGWLDPTAARVYAVLDTLSTHRAQDVLLWALTRPRWELVFQPTYAASLNLIEPWWKILRSLALNGKRFATWGEVCQAVEKATGYWTAHRHPCAWGRRRRHRPRRRAGIGRMPLVTRT